MLCKKYLKQTTFLIRTIGLAAAIPLIIIYICIPFLGFCIYHKYGIGYELWETFTKMTQLFLPFFSAWWGILALRSFVEADGNEILFINNKYTMLIFLWAFIFYVISIAPLYLVFGLPFENIWFEFAKVLIECILFNSIAYFLLFTAQSSAISFAALAIYTILSFFKFDSVSRLLFIEIKEMDKDLFLNKYLPFLILSAVLLTVSKIIGNKRIKFK